MQQNLLLRDAPAGEVALELPAAPEDEEVVWDYATTSLTLRPAAFKAGT